MAEEMKTRSIRADEETLDKFKALSEEFNNQGECLSSLINAYEIAKAKNTLTNMQTDIEDYESHISAIQKAFLHVLELNENTEVRCREELRSLLDSKDKTITDLQNRLDAAIAKSENAEQDHKTLEKENELLSEKIEKLTKDNDNLNDQIKDKKEIIDSLNVQLADYIKIKDEFETKNQIIADFKLERAEHTAEIKSLEAEIDKLNAAIETNKKQAELDKQIAVNEIKSEYMDKLEQVRTEKDNLISEIAKLKDQLISK